MFHSGDAFDTPTRRIVEMTAVAKVGRAAAGAAAAAKFAKKIATSVP